MSEPSTVARRRERMPPPVEWLSLRVECNRPPTDDERALFQAAFESGMDAIRTKLVGNVRAPLDVATTVTVYPLTHCADVHRDLVDALHDLVDRDLTYIEGFVAGGQIGTNDIIAARAALAKAAR